MKDTFTLRELRGKIMSTGNQRLPSAKALRESDCSVVAAASVGQEAELTVYQNGFFLYQASGRMTVGAVDRCGGYVYDGGDELDASAFDDSDWTVRLTLEGEQRLEHNNDKRNSNTYSYSNDGVELGDLRDSFDLEAVAMERDLLERALGCLTDKQRQVVELCFVSGWTQQEVANHLGISQQMVAKTIRMAQEKMSKDFFARL